MHKHSLHRAFANVLVASRACLTAPGESCLLLNFSHYPYVHPKVASNNRELLEIAQKYTRPPPKVTELFIYWPDYGTPNLTATFWQEIWESHKEFTYVIATCDGGHGRSGTAIMCLSAAANYPLTLARFRKEYCENAVETSEQEFYINYVHDVLHKRERSGHMDSKNK